MMGWVAGVARWGAALGWPQIEAGEVAAAATVAGCCVCFCAAAPHLLRRHGGASRRLAIAAAGIGVWVAAGTHRAPLPAGTHLAVHDTDPVVVVVDRPDPARALGQLAAAGIDRIDVLVARSASRAGREAVRVLDARFEVAHVLAPAGLGGRVSYQTVTGPVAVGGLTVEPAAARLRVAPELASSQWLEEP